MGFMDRIRKSWELIGISWDLLMQDKELLVFPIFSTVAAILLFIGIVAPSFLFSVFSTKDISYLGFALWYFATSFVAIFMNAALFLCVKKRLGGGDPTVGYGLKEASKHIVSIFLWSLISASVGLILRKLQDMAENNIIARIVVGLLGMAWALLTLFVVPVLIVENVGVFGAIKRSASLFKKTWGEQVTADVSMGLGFMALYLIGIAVLVAAFFLAPGPVIIAVLGLAIVYFCIVAIFQSTLAMIFNAVLYSYAVGEKVPPAFKSYVTGAFVKKAGR